MLGFEVRVSNDLQRIADGLPEAANEALRDTNEQVVLQQAIRQTGRILQRRIPSKEEVAAYRYRKRGSRGKRRGAGGGPAWPRTGELETQIEGTSGNGEARVTWKAKHAGPRFALGVTRIPKDPALGIVRKNDAPADTVRIVTPQIGPHFEQGLRNKLGL